jgi:hypothetical protein
MSVEGSFLNECVVEVELFVGRPSYLSIQGLMSPFVSNFDLNVLIR